MSPRHKPQPGAGDYPMFDVKAIRKDMEAKLKAAEDLAEGVRELLDNLGEAVHMEDAMHDDVAYLHAEILRACALLRRAGAHEDPRVAPHWLRLLAVAEWAPNVPHKDWRPTQEDLDMWDEQFGDDP